MGSHKKKGVSSARIVGPPKPTYKVTGTITPDATGNYWTAGIHEGKPYYKRLDEEWFLWYDGTINWFISKTVGEFGTSWWYKEFYPETPVGDYEPNGGATGIATVSPY